LTVLRIAAFSKQHVLALAFLGNAGILAPLIAFEPVPPHAAHRRPEPAHLVPYLRRMDVGPFQVEATRHFLENPKVLLCIARD
jgi:hypothetical protein